MLERPTPAQVAGLAALSLPDWEERTRRYLRTERPRVAGRLRELGFPVYPSDSSFLLFRGRRPSGTRPWSGA